MARILITGASGLLGISLALEAMHEHEVIGMDRGKLTSAPFPVHRWDLSQRNAIHVVIDSIQPDWLVNCAAMANLDMCERYPTESRILNTETPGELARVCAERDICFVHISTDAVFDGKKMEPYSEQDQPNPLGVYSRTKLEGERTVQAANSRAIVARVNFLAGA